MNKMLLILVLFLQTFTLCNNKGNRTVTDLILINQLKSSPEKIVISGRELILDTYLWNDFMPVVGESGSSLTGSIRLTGQSGAILSDIISVSKIYFVNNSDIWTCESFETKIIDPDTFEIVVRNCPKLDTSADVDIICEFTNMKQSFRLIAKSQKVDTAY